MKKVLANFKLKEPNASYPTLIYLKSYFNYQRFTYSTGRKIHPQYWHEGSQRPITKRLDLIKKEIKTNPGIDLQNELSVIESLIKQGTHENPTFLTEMQNITTELNRYEDEFISLHEYLNRQKEVVTPNKLKDLLDEVFNKQKPAENSENGFYDKFEEFIQSRMKTNSILTIKKFNTLRTRLLEFEKKKRYKISFENIDLVFYDKFRDFLLTQKNNRTEEVEGLLNDTISKYFSALKTFMQWSMDRNYHANNYFQHKQFSAKKKAKNEIVTLTEEELFNIYYLDLSDNSKLERVRDLFCFATFTGQRWSDIEMFRKEDIKGDSWEFISHKTKKLIIVPFKGFLAPAHDILIKYDYQLPHISQQKFNDYIKEVGEKAGIDEPVEIKRFSGKELIRIKKPKFAYISSHMARRTCITILLEKGIPPTTVMKLSGHSDLKTLMKYENTSKDALAEALENM